MELGEKEGRRDGALQMKVQAYRFGEGILKNKSTNMKVLGRGKYVYLGEGKNTGERTRIPRKRKRGDNHYRISEKGKRKLGCVLAVLLQVNRRDGTLKVV